MLHTESGCDTRLTRPTAQSTACLPTSKPPKRLAINREMNQMAGDWTLPPISNQHDVAENGKSVNMVVLGAHKHRRPHADRSICVRNTPGASWNKRAVFMGTWSAEE